MTDQPVPESTPPATPEPATAERSKSPTGLWVGVGIAAILVIGAAIAIPLAIGNAQAAEQQAKEKAAAAAELERLGTFTTALNECELSSDDYIEILDFGEAISFSAVGKLQGPAYADFLCVLQELGAPDSLESKIGATRALDGAQQDSWSGYEIEWRYHPDDGATVLIEHAQ